MKNTILLAGLAAAISFVGVSVAVAQQGGPRGMPVAELAAELSVTESALQTCMPRPDAGQRPDPSAERPRPDAAAIAECLNGEGATLTRADVEAALGKFAPPPRQ